MTHITLPHELSSAIGSERKDFVVKAGRDQPFNSSLILTLFGTVWTAFTSIFLYTFFGPLFQGKEVHFESNGVPMVASPDDIGSIIIPAIIIGGFALVGIAILFLGIYSIFKKGGYFVGTPSRLVYFQDGNIRSIDWKQFSGDIKVSGNAQKGNISLQMRTGSIVHSYGFSRYTPDVIHILEIPNVSEIEQICRRRIKENDNTPAATKRNFT